MPKTAASPPDREPGADQVAEAAGPERLRVVTWNCHGSVGRDWRCDPERTLSVIERLQPDLLALQEVDGRSHLGRRARAFEFFAERLGGHVAEARTLRRPDRDYGHLLWSRRPIRPVAVHALPGPGIEPRAAIEIVIDRTDGGVLNVLSAHLGLSQKGRQRQSMQIAGLVAAWAGPGLVLGDFNEWRLGTVHRVLSSRLPHHAAPRSWPSLMPLARMDRIYLSSGLLPKRAFLDEEAAKASDHLPLVADLMLR
ncbi:endonuclease/exonuclease/phosphatase family protein [Aurantimonas sp. VKM B-3413]|uniref:endonuclease/exonuclease/phosphatase family protein n=1 Tax=Aurantimonas sp. VKM B-3413 TaxID=2779401 RepID=UPI001E641122|nr:endonuclease/exonuclease/phosphatase family protein [Aurantimonas sp. VKM B-3413]MCB8839308.1 endonuclease/exonuclease/phosphatase family protein [Aurantimonas sp. VKM B-3413]